MMVEFENNDWTLYSIIKGIVVAVPTNPAEERLVEVALDLLLSDISRRVRKVQQKLLGNV